MKVDHLTQLSTTSLNDFVAKRWEKERIRINQFVLPKKQSDEDYQKDFCTQQYTRRFNYCFSSLLFDFTSTEKDFLSVLKAIERDYTQSENAQNPLRGDFKPDLMGMKSDKGEWESYRFYDVLVARGFNKAAFWMEKNYNAKLLPQSVSSLMCLLHLCGIRINHTNSLIKPDCHAHFLAPQHEKKVIDFYRTLKANIDLDTAKNAQEFKLIDYIAKSRAYGALEKIHMKSTDYRPLVAQGCERIYHTLLSEHIASSTLRSICTPNPQNYNYTALDYAIFSENLYFIEKITQICGSLSQSPELNSILAKKDLSSYAIKSSSAFEAINSIFEKARLCDVLKDEPLQSIIKTHKI